MRPNGVNSIHWAIQIWWWISVAHSPCLPGQENVTILLVFLLFCFVPFCCVQCNPVEWCVQSGGDGDDGEVKVTSTLLRINLDQRPRVFQAREREKTKKKSDLSGQKQGKKVLLLLFSASASAKFIDQTNQEEKRKFLIASISFPNRGKIIKFLIFQVFLSRFRLENNQKSSRFS